MRTLTSKGKFALLLCLLVLSPILAQAGTGWSMLDQGHRSYIEELGPAFYESVPVINVKEGSRVVLFNRELARALGLQSPAEFQSLQNLVLNHAAWIVDPSGTSSKKFIATRYLDSGKKAPGEAMGDGRGLWTAEIPLELPDGRFIFIDVFLKGAGQTPLAWFNHRDPSHKDGWQSLGEAVHAYLVSAVSLRNQLNVTGDLAVIELPFSKYDKRSQREMRSAITVRVGNQTRIAHFRYFKDEPENFKKLADFIIRRDIGLPRGATVGKTETMEYLRQLAMNLAEEAAYYHDLHAVHTSPTAGNRTSKGATIDLGTFIYLDAHHVNYSYLFRRNKLGNQTDQIKNYLTMVMDYMKEANYAHAPKSPERGELHRLFDKSFESRLRDLTLARIGLDGNEIAMLPDHVKRDFVRLAIGLAEAQGTQEVGLHGQIIKPAAHDMRELLAGSIELYWKTNGSEDLPSWIDLLTPKRSWATQPDRNMTKTADQWRKMIGTVLGFLPSDSAAFERRISRARAMGAHPRLDQSKSFFKQYDLPIIQAIERGDSFEAVENLVEQTVTELTDHGIRRRTNMNTGIDLAQTELETKKPAPSPANRLSIKACEAVF